MSTIYTYSLDVKRYLVLKEGAGRKWTWLSIAVGGMHAPLKSCRFDHPLELPLELGAEDVSGGFHRLVKEEDRGV